MIILGDSLAAGTPLASGDRWWVRLQSDLSAALPERQVVVDSWAVPGSGVDVLESAARDQPALESYDVAIVIEGVNDEAWTPLDEWRSRYEAAVVRMEERGILVVVGTPPPSLENGAFMGRYDATAAALREVAGNSRPLLDIAGRWRAEGAEHAAVYYADLIHQGPVGQQLMAEMARDVIVRSLDGS